MGGVGVGLVLACLVHCRAGACVCGGCVVSLAVGGLAGRWSVCLPVPLTVSRRSFGDCLQVGGRGWLVRGSECLHTLPQVPDRGQALGRGGLVGAGSPGRV